MKDSEKSKKPNSNKGYGGHEKNGKARKPARQKSQPAQKSHFHKPGPQFREPQREPADDICWGRQPVLDLVRASPGRCTKIVIANNVRPPFLDELVDAARAGKVVYQMAAPEALDTLCPGVRHQGVACRVTEVKLLELEPFLKDLPRDKSVLIVVLDHIEDPHNLGAIVRSAEAAGATAVVVSKRRSALPGGTVVKVSAGAAMRVPIISVVNIARSVEQIKAAGIWTIGLENEAKVSLWEDAPPLRAALVIGAEGEGLSRLVGETCDQLLRIPIQGMVGSLNAGVAAALAMFEWSRASRAVGPGPVMGVVEAREGALPLVGFGRVQ
ncbi:MAG: 23S rRNA (guanosine(2251)-2'-O)-methyltransferase RlmB [Synergistaceae bacterium]|jgi:23S rRNA (guanosine2251-2'-O)-methyltransferase|nr:23S rRNA (guanosine(2251)-2'-O)-methyltransferase RlmB [Synergistaceae bacterium]